MVAVKPWEAERFLAAPPEGVRLFLLYGNDAGGITEGARRVERVALKRGGGDTVLRFGSDALSADPGRIADEATSASLFGGEPVVALRILDGRHNVIGALEPLLARPPDAAWLVVEAGELAPTSPLRKGFTDVPSAAAVPIYRLEDKDLAAFIRAASEAAGLVVEPAALDLLAEMLGGDRLATRNELEKLFLYVGDAGPVTPAHVRAIVGETAEVKSDEIVDAALLGDSEALETGLERLRAEGGSAASLGATALRHLIQLESLSAAMQAGASAGTAVERARPPIFARRRGAVEAALRRWAGDDLAAARRDVAEAIFLTRRQPGLEHAAISAVLHDLALKARRLRRGAAS